MTFSKVERLASPAVTSFLGSARGYFKKPGASSVEKLNEMASETRGGYKDLLENELDRRGMSWCEREDRDDLDRMRNALYGD